MVPELVTRPTSLETPSPSSANQTLPSGPAVMPQGLVFAAYTGNSEMAPVVVMRPMLPPVWVNHWFPSEPSVMPSAPLFGVEIGNSVKLLGTVRSSRTSNRGRARDGVLWRDRAVCRRLRVERSCSSQKEVAMSGILLRGESVRGYNGAAASPGAQTGRRGGAWAGEGFAWRLGPHRPSLCFSIMSRRTGGSATTGADH